MEFKPFTEIHIVLENCEVFKLEPRQLHVFSMDNIYRNIGKYEDKIMMSTYCKDLFLCIDHEVNEADCHADVFPDIWKVPMFERLSRHDIVAIDLIYEDGSKEYIYVNWKGDSDYTNPNQESKIIDSSGDLLLVVSEKEETRNTYFNNNYSF